MAEQEFYSAPPQDPEDLEVVVENGLAHKLRMTGWALFFIWIGIVFIAGLTAGVGLLGVGLITLGVQLARKIAGLKVEGFWIIIGILLLLGGLGKLIKLGIALIPAVLILAGITILWSVYFGKHSKS